MSMEAHSLQTNCSARALAKFAAFMANKGSLNGKQMISEETWNKLHDNPTKLWLNGDQMDTSFTTGGVNKYEVDVPSPAPYWHLSNINGFYGWQGGGGTLHVWNPELKIGVGFSAYEHNEMQGFSLKAGKLTQIV